ncbi:MAG TPA: hypothetical protein VGE01_06330, partial [Fimbriimonas sp.]
MPRKKLVDPAPDVLPTSDEPSPTKTRTSRRTAKKPVETVEAPAEASAPKPAATAPAAKPTRSRKPRTAPSEPPIVETPVVAPEPAVQEAEAPPSNRRPARSRRKPAPAAVEPEVATTPEPPVEPAPEPKPSRRSRSRSKKASPDAVETPEASSGDETGWEDELPVPIWRPLSEAAPARPSEAAPPPAESAETEEDRQGRRKRRRRRGGRSDEESVEPVDEAPAPEPAKVAPAPKARPAQKREPKPSLDLAPPAVPVVPVPRPEVRAPKRAPIEIPVDAPQVVLREGVPTLVRNHRVYPPLFFFGSPSDERRAKTVLEEMALAAEAGVHLHAFLIDFPIDPTQVDATVALAAYLVAKAVEVDPEAQVMFRVALTAPRGWENRFPDARFKDSSGHLAEPSVCDDQFWRVAEECLEAFVRRIRLLDLKDNILGLHLERGEWFIAHNAGYDTSNAAKLKFRDWARTRYLNDEVTLRASWFDGNIRFDSIVVPDYMPEGEEGERFVRSSRKQRRYVDYHLFLSDATVARISDLAYAAKKASDGYFLIGVSYGYTFEWSHPSSGHLSLGKLLRSPEIDFIAGPPSYRSREPGGTSPFPCPIDSFALNGKLYISEEDFKTSLSQGHEPDEFNPPLKTPQALDSVHWRGVGAALAHYAGVSWMDLWGNGWLRSHSVWERAARVRQTLVSRMGVPASNPDVAIFVDERSLAYLVDENAFSYLVQNVRESVLRAGVNVAFYLLSDLQHREKFPDSKLYLFLNAWDIRPELRAAIKSRLQCDHKVLFWLYS